MSYSRWSFSHWYVWADVSGTLACEHINGQGGRYKYNSDIDEFIKDTFTKLSKSDKKELKDIIQEANEDYNQNEKESNG